MLRSKWNEKVRAVIKIGQELNFSGLLKFVEHRAYVSDTMYGQDLATESKLSFIKSNKCWKETS